VLLGQLAVGRRLYRRTSSFPQTPPPLAPTGVAGLAIRRQDAAALCGLLCLRRFSQGPLPPALAPP